MHPATIEPADAGRGVVLVLGSSGFIGRHVAAELRAKGFEVIGSSRKAAGAGKIAVDYMHDHDAATWLPRLSGVDIVVNAVGMFRERRGQTFRAIHADAPRALFAACAQAGVRHVVQVSALGVESGTTDYFRSKHGADEFLMRQPVAWSIVRPSLVYGEEGRSSRLLHLLASLPFIPLPGKGLQQVQPIHVEDLARAIAALLGGHATGGRIIPLVGPRAVAWRDYLAALRGQLGLGATRFVSIPPAIMRVLARLGALVPGSLLQPDALAMLQQGSTASPEATTSLLGAPPRGVDAFIPPRRAASLRTTARLSWLLQLLRLSIAALWLWSGIVSLWVYPREASLALLQQVGVAAPFQPFLLYAAAGLDLLLGLACLVGSRRPWIWLAQIALVIIYTAIITIWLPALWAHPFGPVAKNIPVIAALAVLYLQARDRWNTLP